MLGHPSPCSFLFAFQWLPHSPPQQTYFLNDSLRSLARHLKDVFLRHLKDAFKMYLTRLQDVFRARFRDVLWRWLTTERFAQATFLRNLWSGYRFLKSEDFGYTETLRTIFLKHFLKWLLLQMKISLLKSDEAALKRCCSLSK